MNRDQLYLQDILEAIVRIERYTAADTSVLEHDEPIQSLVLRYVQIIGEAVRGLTPELKAKHPEVPWRAIVRTRNVLVHHYFDIDVPTVREIVERDLPALRPQIKAILDSLPKDVGA